MYSENVISKESKAPAMVTILEKLEKQNTWQSELISMIDDKLNQFLDKRNEPKNGLTKEAIAPTDALSAFLRHLDVMEGNCQRLEILVKHLNDIL